ncbi:GTP binding protein [Aureococcus anophagefferens]|nr:GTP binding protein [Aureococcus anophagefferens]
MFNTSKLTRRNTQNQLESAGKITVDDNPIVVGMVTKGECQMINRVRRPHAAATMGIVDKIKELEAEYARTQKNKATEGHLGIIKAKLSKLRSSCWRSSRRPAAAATASTSEEGVGDHKGILERELETVGLRLNKTPPNIALVKKATGGVKFNATVPLAARRRPAKTVNSILHEFRLHNCEVLFRGDYGTDELIDVINGTARRGAFQIIGQTNHQQKLDGIQRVQDYNRMIAEKRKTRTKEGKKKRSTG